MWPSAVNAFRDSLLALTIVRWASTSNAGLSVARVALPVELVAVLALKHLWLSSKLSGCHRMGKESERLIDLSREGDDPSDFCIGVFGELRDLASDWSCPHLDLSFVCDNCLCDRYGKSFCTEDSPGASVQLIPVPSDRRLDTPRLENSHEIVFECQDLALRRFILRVHGISGRAFGHFAQLVSLKLGRYNS